MSKFFRRKHKETVGRRPGTVPFGSSKPEVEEDDKKEKNMQET